MSTVADGTSLAAALTPLFRGGADYFGRNSGRPRSLEIQQGQVQIGETRVVADPAPVAK